MDKEEKRGKNLKKGTCPVSCAATSGGRFVRREKGLVERLLPKKKSIAPRVASFESAGA